MISNLWRNLDARTMAVVLGGDIIGPEQLLVPGPGHSPKDRSLAVWIDDAAPDGFRVHSFAGDHWRRCREHVCDKLGIPARQPRTKELSPQPAAAGPRPYHGGQEYRRTREGSVVLAPVFAGEEHSC